MKDAGWPIQLAHAVAMALGDRVPDAIGRGAIGPGNNLLATEAPGAHACVVAALTIIVERYREPTCSARTIARSVGISKEYLCRLVKRQTGRTIGSLVHEARVREAARLLRATASTVKEVATSVGYSSAGHLERHFKRRMQTTPVTFRRSTIREAGTARTGNGGSAKARTGNEMSRVADVSTLAASSRRSRLTTYKRGR